MDTELKDPVTISVFSFRTGKTFVVYNLSTNGQFERRVRTHTETTPLDDKLTVVIPPAYVSTLVRG